MKLIKTLITAAYVAGFDETTLRAGRAGQKKYVLGAFTELYSLFFLGKRSLKSFRDFEILPAFAGIVVSDRYQNYFHDGWQHLAGHQPCLALNRRPRLEPWTGQGGREPARRLILVKVPRLELDQVDLPGCAHPFQVPLCKHAALAEIRPEVMDEHASFYVGGRRRPSFEADRKHVERG